MMGAAYGLLVRGLAIQVRLFRPLLSASASSWAAAKLHWLVQLAARRVWLAERVLSSLKWGHSSCVKSVVVIGDHVYTGCWDFLVKKWDARSGECLLSFVGHRQDIIGICAYGRHLFSCGDHVRMWDTETGEEVARFGQGTYYSSIANATHIFCARANGVIEIFAYAEPLKAAAADAPSAGVRETGRVVVSGAVTTPERELTGHLAGVMDFAMRGDMLISASIDHTARAWSISTGALLQTFTGHRDALRCCCLWRDSLFTGSLDRTIRQWSLASGECVGVVQRHGAAVRALLMVGDSLLSASSDFTIVEWDLSECAGGSEEFTQLRTLVGHKDGVFSLCEHDGVLYSGSADRTCKRWNLRSGAVTQEYASRSPIEAGAVVLELSLRTPLREALPLLTSLRPLARLVELWRDVQEAANPSDALHAD